MIWPEGHERPTLSEILKVQFELSAKREAYENSNKKAGQNH